MSLVPNYVWFPKPGYSVWQQSADYEELDRIGMEHSNITVRGINEVLEKNMSDLKSSYEKSNAELRQSIDELMVEIGIGIDEVNSNLVELNYSLSNIEDTLRNGFGELIHQLIAMNISLVSIQELLKIPDNLKELAFYLEQGLRFYLKGAYDDAIEELEVAKGIYAKDYFTFFFLGKAFFRKGVELDLRSDGFDPNASELFTKAIAAMNPAIKYASLDDPIDGYFPRLLNLTGSNLKETLSSKMHNGSNFFPVEGNYYKGIALYRLGKFEEACESFRYCFKADPINTAYSIYYAKSLVSIGSDEEAWGVILDVLVRDPANGVYWITNPELVQSKVIRESWSNHLKATRSQAMTCLERVEKLELVEELYDQYIRPEVNAIRNRLRSDNYLDYLKAIAELENEKEWTYYAPTILWVCGANRKEVRNEDWYGYHGSYSFSTGSYSCTGRLEQFAEHLAGVTDMPGEVRRKLDAILVRQKIAKKNAKKKRINDLFKERFRILFVISIYIGLPMVGCIWVIRSSESELVDGFMGLFLVVFIVILFKVLLRMK